MHQKDAEVSASPECSHVSQRKHRGLKICLACLLVIVLAFAAVSVFYVQDYYHADDTAISCIESPAPGITITEGTDHSLIFSPEDASAIQAGLIFYPGGKVEYTAYAPLMTLLAQQGMFCVLVRMPGNLAILNTDAAAGITESYPDISRWFIGGHSLGGVCAAMYLQKHSGEFEGLILLGAYSSVDLSSTGLSVLSLYGSCDGVLNREKYEAGKANLPSDFTEKVLQGGCHAYFGSYGPQKGDGTPTCQPEAQQAWTADAIMDWIG